MLPSDRVFMCKFCNRWLTPPNGWVYAQQESKEMLAILLKKLKPTMKKVSITLLKIYYVNFRYKHMKSSREII